jgi:hypothetical protein
MTDEFNNAQPKPAFTWKEFLARCRKGLNYLGAACSFLGRKFTEFGGWLESIS